MGQTQNPKPPSILYASEYQVWFQNRAAQLQPGGHIQLTACFSKVSLNTAKIIYCILTMAAFILQWQSLVVTVDSMACKPKAFAIWSFAESLQTTVMELKNPVRTSALPLFLAVPHQPRGILVPQPVIKSTVPVSEAFWNLNLSWLGLMSDSLGNDALLRSCSFYWNSNI